MKLQLFKGYWTLFTVGQRGEWMPLASFANLADAVLKVPEAEVIA